MKTTIALVLALVVAAPAAAQTRRPPQPRAAAASRPAEPLISVRPFVMGTRQRFAAQNTFDAVFGRMSESFWGGGAQVVLRHGVYAELGASRFRKTGQRAVRFNGQTFRLGIPLTATITPVELTGGYRVRIRKHPRLVPYGGAGVGWYAYKETSDFSEATENVDTRHAGFLAVGGLEVRVHRWVGLAVDGQYTHVPGILGSGGISQDARTSGGAENDLGGIAARVKVVVGR